MNISDLPFADLKKYVMSRLDLAYDIEFARRIASRMERESNFFFGEYSIPFLQDIALYIAHENSYHDILGFYYDFVSNPLIKEENGSETPQFKMLRGYKGQHGARLYTYVMVCTRREAIRHFNNQKPGSLVLGRAESFDFEHAFMRRIHSDDDSFIHSDNDEIAWEILNAFFYDEVESEELHSLRIKKVKKAFKWLQEKDRLVLQYLVIDDKSGIEAFELLKKYLRPKSDDANIEEWNDIKKQNTMSLWKTRALKHLEIIVKNPSLKV